MTSPSSPVVYLIGAGPGDPGLITLRGVECLRRADIVLYDYLVDARVLRHARPNAELIHVGKHGEGRVWTQEEIHAAMLAWVARGRTVARLKGGDPAIFARTGDELEVLTRAGVSFEVVPGVTAVSAASSHAGIALTSRQAASAVALVTGQEAVKDAATLDFAGLAAFPGTLVFYMGVTTANRWTRELIAAGKSPTTPAAIVRNCSLGGQTVTRCELQGVPASLAAAKTRPPAVIIVGEVVRASSEQSWFTRRPLFGQRVVVTRPEQQAAPVTRVLEEAGADVLLQPAIEIVPPDDWGEVDALLPRLKMFDWVVFSSGNAVRLLLDRVRSSGRDARVFGEARIASVGPGTTEELLRYMLNPDCQPGSFNADSLADELVADAQGRRFLLPGGDRGRDVLASRLSAAGGIVERVIVYRSVDVETPSAEVVRRLESGGVDWVTVTSPAIAQSLIRLFGDRLRKCRLASISPLTTKALRAGGFEPASEAADASMEGLVRALSGNR